MREERLASRAAPPAPARPYREITVASVIFGVVVGVVLNASITYAGLKIGFTLSGSAIVAVLGFGVLRALLRRGTIVEVNIAQTIGSAVNISNAGVIFTVPVLLLMGHSLSFSDPNFWWLTLAASAGAMLGVLFIVPLRKQMIDIERLRFPSGTAVAAILKSPGAGAAKTVVLIIGVVVGAAAYAPVVLPSLNRPGLELPGYSQLDWRVTPRHDADGALLPDVDRDGDGRPDLLLTDSVFDLGRFVGLPPEILLTLAITPLSFGAGFVTGPPGLMVLAGGVIAVLLLNPLAFRLGWIPETTLAHEVGDFALTYFNRPLGIGLLLGGAMMGMIAALPAVREALRSLARGGGARGASDDLSMRVLIVMAGFALVGLLLAAEMVRDPSGAAPSGLLSGLPPVLAKFILVAVAALWIWFAGIIIAQCSGMTDWSPISGLALLTVVLVMSLEGREDVFAAVLFGVALCAAIGLASDMMQDLKTGHLVGSIPRRQQIVEAATAAIGPVIAMCTLVLIANVNVRQTGVPLGPGTDAPAPQAMTLLAVVTGVQGGEMPYAMYGFGALLGALLGIGAFPSLGVLVGLSMFLPTRFVMVYGLGCVANMICKRVFGRSRAEEWGVPFCAGLIVGEALLALTVNAIVLAVPKA